jgi:apolipoprotein N-acyltransferase
VDAAAVRGRPTPPAGPPPPRLRGVPARRDVGQPPGGQLDAGTGADPAPDPGVQRDRAQPSTQDGAPAGRGEHRVRRARRRAVPSPRPLLAAAAGGLLVLAFPPYGIWPLAFVSVAVFAGLLPGRSARAGAGLGLAFGLAFFVPLLRWSGIYVGPVPWLMLAGAQAAFLAVLGAAATALSRLPGWPVWFAALWVAQEAARARGPFDGFPWGRLAFSQGDSPVAWLAAYGGAPLVSFAVALAGGLVAVAAGGRRRPRRAAAAALGLVAVGTAAALARTAAIPDPGAPTITVAIVQGNVPRLGLDFNAQRTAVLRNHVERTLELADAVRAGRQPRPQLVVWPENASDIDPLTDAEAAAEIDRAARAVGVPILVGAILDGPGPDHVTNAGIVWDPVTGPGERYVKRHPVPFGEYIPLRRIARLVSKDVDRVGRDMVAGSSPGLLRVGPTTVGDVICFEVAYDGLVRDVARAGLLVVQTNNATFGRSGETWQQLAMGRLRAIEHNRTVLVAATSGVSAIIEPDGHVAARSDVFTADLLVRAVPVERQATLATRVGARPEWFLVAVAAAALGYALALRAAPRRRPAGHQRTESA